MRVFRWAWGPSGATTLTPTACTADQRLALLVVITALAADQCIELLLYLFVVTRVGRIGIARRSCDIRWKVREPCTVYLPPSWLF